MKKTLFALVGAMLLLLTACNPNTPSAISVRGKIYKHPEKVQYLKFATDSVQYYGDFGNETLNNHTFAYSQKDEVVTVYTPTIEHLLAYEGFVLRGDTIYEQVADASDSDYQDHQPQDPKAFSLVGKRYATDHQDYGREDTLLFITADMATMFSRERADWYSYKLNYPDFRLLSDDGYSRIGVFKDTSTLYLSGSDYFIIK